MQPAVDQRLYKEGVWLEDEHRSLAELRVENDDELAVVFRQAGARAPASGMHVHVHDSVPLFCVSQSCCGLLVSKHCG